MSDCFMRVDTALSTEGHFALSPEDVIVEILTPYDWKIVVISARYTAADVEEAAEIAVNAYHEREGHEVPWQAMGQPFYHVQVSRRDGAGGKGGIVRLSEDGDWAWVEEEEEEVTS